MRKRSEYRELEFKRRKKITLQDFTVWIVSKEDLMISKLCWAKDSHSKIQLQDVRNLLVGEYDKSYLQYWTDKLDVAYLLKECLHE